ncbi:MAG: UpxY family transcription antiterminator [bacterium]
MDEEIVYSLKWYALYTRSRHERLINEQLRRREIDAFLPLRKVKKQWSDRVKIVEEPLFRGYVFVKTNLIQKLDVLMIKGAVKFVSNGYKLVPVPEKDILSLRTMVENNVELDNYPYLKEGNRVYIKKGPFKGVEGYIVRKDQKNHQLVLSIDAIMQSAAMKIDMSMVEKL